MSNSNIEDDSFAAMLIDLPEEEKVLECAKSFPEEFPVIDLPISYAEFFRRFIAANIPCLIKGDATGDWPCRKDWVDQDGRPSLDFLAERVVPAEAEVPVSDCGEKYFNSQKCVQMTFGQFCSSFKSGDGRYYLKDWHFHKENPSYKAYKTPAYFCSDWLNEYLEREGAADADSDYRFVYVGPKGSWTPFHSDVFGSFSWSANVAGKKKWVFYPPGQEAYLKDETGRLVYDVNEVRACDMAKDRTEFKKAHLVEKSYEVIQETGDIIFVPSMWHHQVVNLEDTISINHNWFNGANIGMVFEVLKQELNAVENEISDCKADSSPTEWEDTCQSLLRANHGMNLADFLDLLEHVARKRLSGGEAVIFDESVLGAGHARYDLDQISEVIEQVARTYPDSPRTKARCDDLLLIIRPE